MSDLPRWDWEEDGPEELEEDDCGDCYDPASEYCMMCHFSSQCGEEFSKEMESNQAIHSK